jgi:quercetin dioxygenase-like cupin family protein
MTSVRGRAEMGVMPRLPRRVVTGHDTGGRSVFASDEPVPAAHATPGGTLFYELWATDAAPNGTTLRINEMPPGASSPMHRTRTVDYGIVLDGEVVLVLDDSETVLRAGDVVVQRGTSHRWENRSDAPARVAFILIDGAFA